MENWKGVRKRNGYETEQISPTFSDTIFKVYHEVFFLKKTLVFPEGSYFLQLFSSNPAPADRRGGAGKAGSSCFLLPLPPPPPPEVEESRKGGGEGKGHFGKHPSFPDCQSKKKDGPKKYSDIVAVV